MLRTCDPTARRYFAHEAAGFGVEVHLVNRGALPLRGFDEDVRAFVGEQATFPPAPLAPSPAVDAPARAARSASG